MGHEDQVLRARVCLLDLQCQEDKAEPFEIQQQPLHPVISGLDLGPDNCTHDASPQRFVVAESMDRVLREILLKLLQFGYYAECCPQKSEGLR